MSKTRVISVTSGKGGTGKSNVTVNLGLAIAATGKRVLLLDADSGLANLDVLLGITPKHTMFDVLRSGTPINDVIVNYDINLDVLPGASGIEELATQSTADRLLLLETIGSLSDYDFMLIDTRAGLSSDVTYFNSAANEILLVTTPEPTAMTDAYAMIKIMATNHSSREFGVIVNQVASTLEGHKAFEKLRKVAAKHLDVSLELVAALPFDSSLREAVNMRRPVITEFPSSKIASCFRTLGNSFASSTTPVKIKGGVQFFFQQLIEQGAYGC